LNLALSLAEAEQRVLVVDADLRRPTVHLQLALEYAPGFTDVVAEEQTFEEAVERSVVPGLDVLTCGTPVRRPSRFFSARAMVDGLQRLRQHYDWILLDAPPALVVNDAAVLSTSADGTIIVVTSGSTRFDALERAVEFIQAAGGSAMGVVLNKFNPKSAYGGYYGSYKYGHYDNRHGYYKSAHHA
jgi:capsular exopolysaccharide synthesis family protein